MVAGRQEHRVRHKYQRAVHTSGRCRRRVVGRCSLRSATSASLQPAWSPDGKWIAYQSDTDGDEQWDIFLVSTKNGDVINLTNTPEIAEEGPAWSPDGKYLAYMVKPKTSSTYEIDLIDIVYE